MRKMKKYILDTFKFRELGESFTAKMKAAAMELRTLPTKHKTVGFQYRGYDIYLKPYRTYLFFYVVDDDFTITVLQVLQDGMDWQYILERWLSENG